MSAPLTGPYYYGAKNRLELRKWICSHLPDDYRMYTEPFCGMLGILLYRGKAKIETINDLNGRVTNWWTVVRDKSEELYEKLLWTPCSEELYYNYYDTMDEGDDVERAAKYLFILMCSRMHSDNRRAFSYRLTLSASRGPAKDFARYKEKLEGLRKRLEYVTILNRPAEVLLKRLAVQDEHVIYCDPPYATADTSPYSVVELDNLKDVISQQKSKVAISGYGNEWDDLGWTKHELEVSYAEGIKGRAQPKRVEVLWTNYKTGSQLRLGEDV